ncbi:MAG: HAD family hydrolase [Candidatus Hodarchaeota archaeon]
MNNDRFSGFKAVVFDWSGVLMDEIEATIHAHIATIKMLGGRKISFEELSRNIGPDWRPLYVNQGIDPDKIPYVHDVYTQKYEQFFHLVQPYDGVPEMLSKLKKRGLTLAVLSNQMRKLLFKSAHKYNIIKFFDLIVTAEDKEPPKPNVAALKSVLKKLKIEPSKVIYVDDMQEAIKMGKIAKVFTIGVRSALGQDLSIADLQIDKVSMITDLLVSAWPKSAS